MQRFQFLNQLLILCAGIALFLPSPASGDSVILKDGTILEGNSAYFTSGVNKKLATKHQFGSQGKNGTIRNLPVILSEMQKTFVARRQIVEIIPDSELNKYVTFTLKHTKPFDHMRLGSIGQLVKVTPFNGFGERTVRIKTRHGEKELKQHLLHLTPIHAVISGLSSVAPESAIATKSIPLNELDAILHNTIDSTKPSDYRLIVQFYLQMGYYFKAISELKSLIKNFPEYKIDTEEVFEELYTLQAKDFLRLLKKREEVGQLEFAYKYANLIPNDNIIPEIKVQIDDFRTDYKNNLEKVELCLFLIEDFASQIKDENISSGIAPYITIIKNELSIHSLSRLESFLKLSSDTSLTVDEKLSLALSGWVLGNVNASTEIKASIRYWETRFNISQYLKTESAIDRQTILEQIKATDDISASIVKKMLPLLPLPMDSSDISPLTITNFELERNSDFPGGKYSVILPPEYNPLRTYPLLVVLRTERQSTESMIKLWSLKKSSKDGHQIAGPALEYGYIVISPEYLSEESSQSSNSALAKTIVVKSIQDVRKRFQIDSDHVFLTGHEKGGNTAFEIALSRPDIFAGVIPITGMITRHASRYRKNGKALSWYVVSGELDRNTLSNNDPMLDSMLKSGTKIIYTQYLGRGYEQYYSEFYRILEWMGKQERLKYPKDIEFKTIRPTDRRIYWYDTDGIPSEASMVKTIRRGRKKYSPKIISADVNGSNTIRLSHLKKSTVTIWLSPEIVDFDQKVTIKFTRSKIAKFKGFLEERIGDLIEDLRIRGDRQKPYSVKLVLQ